MLVLKLAKKAIVEFVLNTIKCIFSCQLIEQTVGFVTLFRAHFPYFSLFSRKQYLIIMQLLCFLLTYFWWLCSGVSLGTKYGLKYVHES